MDISTRAVKEGFSQVMEYVPETVYCVMKRFGTLPLASECEVVVWWQ